jgi:hypothetical protein
MKMLLAAVLFVMALNFAAVIGGAGYLWRTGHLDRDKIKQIKAILFPTPPAAELATGAGPTTEPTVQLDDLLRKASGLSAEEQVAFLQRSFDANMAQLDLRQRQLTDQQHQVDYARQKLAEDRAALEADRQALAAQQQQAAQEASDQGFQDSLQLYNAMPTKQVKGIFMTLSDETMMRYLEAMTPGKAAKIIKEFKTPDETDRIQKVLERMRLQNADGSATQPTAENAPAAENSPTAGTTPGLP